MATRPSSYLNWTDGSAGKVAQPPSAACLQGWTAGQPPPYQWANWQIWLLDQWVQYLDGRSAGGAAGQSAVSNARLIGGGTWSSSGGALAWSAPFNVAIPGLADSANVSTGTSGAVTCPDGSIAYVQLNTPFTYTGNITSGSTSVTALSATAGLVTGMAVSGPGIASGTTLSAISGTTLTLSSAATATATGSPLTFQSSGALSVQASPEAALTPGPQTCVIARNVGGTYIVGVGAGEMTVQNGEAKALRGAGFAGALQFPAGVALSAGQVVYVSPGNAAGDTSRTAGSAYLVDASATGLIARTQAIGIVAASVSSGQIVSVVPQGVVGGFSGLVAGNYLYADPSNAGGITQTAPQTTIGAQANILVGVAISSTQVRVLLPSFNQVFSATPTFSSVSATNIGATNVTASAQVSAQSVSTGTISTGTMTGTNGSGRVCLWQPAQVVWAAGVIATNNGIVTQTGAGPQQGMSATWSGPSSGVERCAVNFSTNVPTSAIVVFSPMTAPGASQGSVLPAGYAIVSSTQISFYFILSAVAPSGTTLGPTQFSFQVLTGTA